MFPINFDNVLIENRRRRGQYSDIYTAYEFSQSLPLALKLQKLKKSPSSNIHNEIEILKKLHSVQGIPKVYWEGEVQGRYGFLSNLLGKSLQKLHNSFNNFSLESIMNLAVMGLNILQGVHEKGFIHGNLTPENFFFGKEKEENQLFLIDFNATRSFLINHDQSKHVPFSTVEEFNANMEFVSAGAHDFIQASRKDDLESLGYVLCYLFLGKLKWQNIKKLTLRKLY